MGQQGSSEPQPEGPNNPEATWWCRLLAKVIGTVGGIICLITAIWTCVTVHPICIGAGILQMVAGFIVLVFEAPICCSFIDLTKPIQTFAEKRTFIQRAVIYIVLAIPPLAMCFELSTLFGCGVIFAAGVFYGLMALGKKADREQMRANAQGGPEAGYVAQPTTTSPKSNLIANEEQPSSPYNR